MNCWPNFGCILGILTLLVLSGCQISPATGKKNFNVIPESQEISLGSQAAPGFLHDYGGQLPDSYVVEYVRDIGKRLASVSERSNLPWEFNVVNTDQINAFALPGGKVFITRGLLAKLGSEAELAGVLGHEIGHVTDQHIGQQMSQAILIQGLAIGLGVAGEATDSDYLRVIGLGTQVGGTVYLLKFGRDQEHAADELGLRYMTRLGYNPVGQLRVMETLQAASGNEQTLEFLSTHPLPQSRIDTLQKIIATQYPDYENFNKYSFRADEYKVGVLNRLAKLPPAPKVNPSQTSSSAYRTTTPNQRQPMNRPANRQPNSSQVR